ncbi:SDR family oxidoreductase [Streptomyces sp. NPDC056296]|uniref:SDR family oxidoreductase n=1 Tax=Streptomyces sp. NPDC056296 TaxID=3345775 RepID=UPI0035DD331E
MDTTGLFSLEGRTALVTGGSRGIGRMIAEGFLAQGARVYITARKAEACDAAARELSELGECHSLPGDVSSVRGNNELVARYAERESALDVLVNNAGAAWAAPFDEFPESGWDKVMDLNVKGLFFLTQALKPFLVRSAGAYLAKVINIASVDGIALNPGETYSYHASKAGVIHLTRRMALELVKSGIVVSAIAPGAFASEMNRAARDHAEEVIGYIPSRRIGEPEDMAAAAIYLASRAGDYVLGSTVIVDGGASIA